MGEAEQQLVDDLACPEVTRGIGADRAAHRRQRRVGRIAADEVVLVEALELVVADASGHGRDVIDVG